MLLPLFLIGIGGLFYLSLGLFGGLAFLEEKNKKEILN